ncbi:TPA: V-type ATP synthase subunit I [Candidatus Poribacteria bacterium]|nr:V-type ATP synthase subunit I [Candidatus Poribacteria bacterium]
MAVCRMSKVQIIAHNSLRDEIVGYLHEKGIIHITNLREKVEEAEEIESDPERPQRIRELTEILSRIQFAIDYLGQFEERKGGLFSFSGGKLLLSPDRYAEIISSEALPKWREIADRCYELSGEVNRLESQLSRINADRAGLQVWWNLDVPIERLRDTDKVAVRVGSIPSMAYQDMASELEETTPYHHLETINLTGTEAYFVLTFLKEEEPNINPILAKYGFPPASFPRDSGRISEILSELDEEERGIREREEEIASEAKGFLKHRSDLMALHDHLSQELERLQVQESFLETRHVFMIEGWVREKDLEGFREDLAGRFKEIEIYAFDPAPDEEPPIAIENNKLVEPFQMVTNLYGMPRYREIDPTPFFAPFFAFFFGICLTDAGYGLVVILLSILGLKLFAKGRGARQLMGILLLSGVMTIVTGLLTGGFFGMHMPSPFSKLIIVDPTTPEGQKKFLYISWGIGVVQVWIGFLIKFLLSVRDRKFNEAFRSDLPWVVMIPAAVMLLPGDLRKVGLTLFVICSVWIIALSDVESKSIVGKIGNGFFNWYGISGVFGDVLSYSRLFALGLATGIIAQVVNTIAKMISGVPGLGPVLMVGVLIGGHLFNIVINALGGFIHTARLQFVEYFTKFFEGGGESFRPFARESKYVVVMDLESLR